MLYGIVNAFSENQAFLKSNNFNNQQFNKIQPPEIYSKNTGVI